jgi:hypothetical protein
MLREIDFHGGLGMKSQIAASHKPGLHKDVNAIFNEGQNTGLENIQYVIETQPVVLIPRHKGEKSISQNQDNGIKQKWNGWPLMPPKKKKKQKKSFSFSRLFRHSK